MDEYPISTKNTTSHFKLLADTVTKGEPTRKAFKWTK